MNLLPYKKAIKDLIDGGMTATQIAFQLGVSEEEINSLIISESQTLEPNSINMEPKKEEATVNQETDSRISKLDLMRKKYKQLFNAIPFSIAKMKEDDSFVSLRMQSIKDFYEELKNCSESIDKKRLIISLDKMVSSLEDYDVPEEDCIFLSDMIKDFLGSPLENLSIGNKRRKSIYFTYEKENHKIKRFCPRKKSYEC